ncbi:MAG: hypothetical protein JO255_12010 [Alphaproteobacteria bacterium]|nr:hypothetical protein [Alphaproteobacteria bacterium]
MASPQLLAAYRFDFLVLIVVVGLMGAATLLIRTEAPASAAGPEPADPSRKGP